jgi:hypothetical protein
MQFIGNRERTITPHRHQRINTSPDKIGNEFIGAVRVFYRAIRLDDGEMKRIALVGGANDGPPQVRNSTHVFPRELHHTALGVEMRLQNTGKSVTNAPAFPPPIDGSRNHRANDGVKTRGVTTAGADGDASNWFCH